MSNKRYEKLMISIIVIYIFVTIALPIIFNHTIFAKPRVSNLSSAEWVNFLGSYAGGTLGGLGTLIAMYITIKNSMDVIENEYKRHKDELDIERKKNDKRERQRFVCDVARELGIYITHISNYYFSFLDAMLIKEGFDNAKIQLDEIERDLENIDNKLSKAGVDSPEFLKLNTERNRILDEKERRSRIYNEKLMERRSNSEFGNRLKANEKFFTLKAFFSNVKSADDFLKKLDDVHNGNGYIDPEKEEKLGQWIGKGTEELLKEFFIFREKYVENTEN